MIIIYHFELHLVPSAREDRIAGGLNQNAGSGCRVRTGDFEMHITFGD